MITALSKNSLVTWFTETGLKFAYSQSMNKFLFIFGSLGGLAALMIAGDKTDPKERRKTRRLEEHLRSKGFRVHTEATPGGDQVVRFRGGYEELMNLVDPGKMAEKPPLPPDLDINNLPRYNCGCPHCGKMSLYGEGQWRYQELSRTRGAYNNTTTYLTQCRKCNGFMKSTVDHDD